MSRPKLGGIERQVLAGCGWLPTKPAPQPHNQIAPDIAAQFAKLELWLQVMERLRRENPHVDARKFSGSAIYGRPGGGR